MEQKPDKKNEKKNQQEEIDDLKQVIEKLRQMQEDKEKREKQKRPRRPILAIEFGAVFHPNKYINLAFMAIINFVLAFFVLEVFEFAEYHDEIVILLMLMAMYTILEEVYRNMVLRFYFTWIIKSFGSIFFFGYLLIFFILDQYIFGQEFNFTNGTLLAFFVLIFVIVRYVFSANIRKFLRRRT